MFRLEVAVPCINDPLPWQLINADGGKATLRMFSGGRSEDPARRDSEDASEDCLKGGVSTDVRVVNLVYLVQKLQAQGTATQALRARHHRWADKRIIS